MDMIQEIRANFPVVVDPSVERVRVEHDSIHLAPGLDLCEVDDRELGLEIGHALTRSYLRTA